MLPPIYCILILTQITKIANQNTLCIPFYIDKLGFQLRGLSFSQEGMESSMLMSLGNAMLEFRCQNDESILSPQRICLKVKRLDRLRRMLQVNAPDHVTIVFTE